jgi:hypothetical protein
MKWVLLAVGAVLVAVLAFLARGLFVREDPEGQREDVLPEVEETVKERVRVAEEEALVARVEARTEAETDREELKEIAQENDGAERRRRLAAMLRRM